MQSVHVTDDTQLRLLGREPCRRRLLPDTVGNMMTNTTYRRIDLEDANGSPFRFDGYELGYASSQQDDRPKPRWMELRIFKTKAGSYVLEIIGQTSLPNEVVKSRAHVYVTASELIDAMHTEERDRSTGAKTGVKYLTYTARDALYDAMDEDDELKAAWANRVTEVA